MGTLIESVKGVKNGEDGKYWQYWVNGKYSDVASDKYILKDGDLVIWKFGNLEISGLGVRGSGLGIRGSGLGICMF